MEQDRIGQVIGGRYRILNLLGEGGFGRAFLADAGPLGKVVLKETWANLGDRLDAREMLRHEATMLAEFGEIEHIPAMMDFIPGAAGESQWLVMEYIDGIPVGTALENLRNQFGSEHHLRTIGQWAIELTGVLDFLHRFSPTPVVHCDINRENVMLRKNGKLTLIDFGIARALPSDQSTVDHNDLTRRIGAMGAPGFAAPELTELRIGPKLDIFSAGVMLNWWLTGVAPEGKYDENNNLIDSFPRTPVPEKRGNELWDGLVDISEKGRAENADDRFHSAAEMELALRRLLADPNDVEEATFPCQTCTYELRAAQNFCPSCGAAIRQESFDAASAGRIAITFGEQHNGIKNQILNAARDREYASLNRFEVFQQLQRAQKDPGFSELISLPYLPRVDKLDHQIHAAKTALGQMRGFCLLADEVGLGKTIEAGIILKELMLRNLVNRVLIVASTTQMALQWQQELFEKFEIFFPVFGKDVDYSLAWNCDRIITSYQIAENRIHRAAIEKEPYDLVIMDEAHHLISGDSYNQRQGRILNEFAGRLGATANYFLMLSATPFHNELQELHKLLWLLKPGAVDEYQEFEKRYVNKDDPLAPPKNAAELREKLSSVMIRNIRRNVMHLNFPRRVASDMSIAVRSQDKRLFDDFRGFVRDNIWNVTVRHGSGSAGVNRDFRVALQRIVESFHSSSQAYRHACDEFLANFKGLLKTDRYAELPGQLKWFGDRMSDDVFEGKIERTYEILRAFQGERKFLIFTQYADTAEVLYQKLAAREDMQIELYPTDEDYDGSATMDVLDRFKRSSRAMVCSENAAEGLNLQKDANSMINFDLPWDPMKLEQRIGRIQRIGQESRNIYIYNLFFGQTVEEDIYQVLKQKLRLFEATVGQVEDILGNMIGEDQFELQMLDLFVHRGDAVKETEIEDRLDDYVYAKSEKVDQGMQMLNQLFGGDEAIESPEPTRQEFAPVSLFRRCRECKELLEPGAEVCSCGADIVALNQDPADGEEYGEPDMIVTQEAAAVFCPTCRDLAEAVNADTYFCETCQQSFAAPAEDENEGGQFDVQDEDMQ